MADEYSVPPVPRQINSVHLVDVNLLCPYNNGIMFQTVDKSTRYWSPYHSDIVYHMELMDNLGNYKATQVHNIELNVLNW